MKLQDLNVKQLFFVVLLIGLGLIVIRLFLPFLDVIVLALIIVGLFYPIFQRLYKFFNSKAIASSLSTILVFIFVFIPLFMVVLLATNEVINLVQQLTPGPNNSTPQLILQIQTDLRPTIQEVNRLLTQLKDAGLTEQGEINIVQIASDLLKSVQSLLLPLTTAIISGAVNVLFYLFLLVLSLLYIFSDYDRLPRFLTRISPLEDKIDELLISKFSETTRAVIIGNFLVAMAQATVVIIPIVVMGIGAPVLLWLSMVILSLIPVGAGLIFGPLGLLLIITGRPAEGIFLIVYGAIMINVVDASLRPRLLKGKVQLHPLIIIFSVIGGITVFGPLGILYGPLISVFFTSLMEVYNAHFTVGKNAQISI